MAEEAYVPASTSQAASSPSPEPWKLLGRDSPAGKALYKLYGGDQTGKAAGNSYHSRNKAMHDHKLATGWTPQAAAPEPAPERPQVSYPKFGTPKRSPSAAVNHIPRRKPGEAIMKEMADEQHRMREQRPPPPKGTLLDEAEKQRCAAAMQYRGAVPEPTAAEIEEARAARGVRRGAPRTKKEELQAMFDAVVQEIDERREFLAEMERVGGLKQQHVHQVRAEIQQRCVDMEKIDRMLQSLGDDR